MKTKLSVILLTLICAKSFCMDAVFSFKTRDRDESQGIVKTYSLWIQETNEPDKNRHIWITKQFPIIPSGGTNAIVVNETNLPPVCWAFVTADGLSTQSGWSEPCLYDRAYLITQLKPSRVTGLGVTLKN